MPGIISNKTDPTMPGYNDVKKLFTSAQNDYGPYIYLHCRSIPVNDDASETDSFGKTMTAYRKTGYRGVILLPDRETTAEEYIKTLGILMAQAYKNSMYVFITDDACFMREYIGKTGEACDVLFDYEYQCSEDGHFEKTLSDDGVTLSVTTSEIDSFDTFDLRGYFHNGVLKWDKPAGNFTVHQYVCKKCDEKSPFLCVKTLNYNASQTYIKATLGAMCDAYADEPYFSALKGILARDISFGGENRRIWDASFAEKFTDMFGFDPSPYYGAMFGDIGPDTAHYKAMFMNCRTKMLTDGYIDAVGDFCAARELLFAGYVTEGKIPACSWLFGDAMSVHKYTVIPAVSMPYAHLYGLNALKPAAGAMFANNRAVLAADMFDKYRFTRPGYDIIRRETMNAFSRGVNMVYAHLGDDVTREYEKEPEAPVFSLVPKKDEAAEYCNFVSRCCAMLRGGRHMCDVAIIYPVYSLQSNVYLYAEHEREFEYPPINIENDYMSLMNTVNMVYGIDAEFVHPETINEKSHSEDGSFFVNNDNTFAQYKLVILPGASMVSLKTMTALKKFYDEGGKIIATVRLPNRAFEFTPSADPTAVTEGTPLAASGTVSDNDKAVRDIVNYIFGIDAEDKSTMRTFYKNENDAGGIAYFLESATTAADGSDLVSEALLRDAIEATGISRDIIIPDMPKFDVSGMLNHTYPVFSKIGLEKRLEHCGCISFIHKKYAGCEIYYIANTRNDPFDGDILLKGRHVPEEWNPDNGKIRRMNYEYVSYGGDVYTKTKLSLQSATSLFIVSDTVRDAKEALRETVTAEAVGELPVYD